MEPSTTTIKVSTHTRDRIKSLGATRKLSADAVIQEALAELEKRVFWEQFDRAVQIEGEGDLRAEAEKFSGSLTDGL